LKKGGAALNLDNVKEMILAELGAFEVHNGPFEYFLRVYRDNEEYKEFDEHIVLHSFKRTSPRYNATDPDIALKRTITDTIMPMVFEWLELKDPGPSNIFIYYNDPVVGTKVNLE